MRSGVPASWAGSPDPLSPGYGAAQYDGKRQSSPRTCGTVARLIGPCAPSLFPSVRSGAGRRVQPRPSGQACPRALNVAGACEARGGWDNAGPNGAVHHGPGARGNSAASRGSQFRETRFPCGSTANSGPLRKWPSGCHSPDRGSRTSGPLPKSTCAASPGSNSSTVVTCG